MATFQWIKRSGSWVLVAATMAVLISSAPIRADETEAPVVEEPAPAEDAPVVDEGEMEEKGQPVAGDPYKKEDPAFHVEAEGAEIEGQSIGLLEWSDDQGKNWHPVNGEKAEAIPPVLQNYTIGFRAQRANPAVKWPDDPFKPTWRVTSYEERTVEHIGETIWVMWEHQAPEGIINGTVSVDCGNTVTAIVREVYNRD